jgi:hypothetical protein
MGSKDNCNRLANWLLRGRFKTRLAMYLVKLVLDMDSQDSCLSRLGLVRRDKSPDYKYIP